MIFYLHLYVCAHVCIYMYTCSVCLYVYVLYVWVSKDVRSPGDGIIGIGKPPDVGAG